MSKGLSKKLTQVGLPLGLGVVGSLSLIVWSQKPLVQPAMAAATPVTAVTDQQTASFDPYHPTASVQDSAPAVAPVMVSYQPQAQGGSMAGSNYAVAATVSTGSNELPTLLTVSNSSDAGKSSVSPAFQAAAVGAATSDPTGTVIVNAKSASITVGTADIYVLSSANIHYVN